jgi:uncharacterized protein with GYD domain
MPRYLVQASYNTQGIADLVKNPQDRAEAVRRAVEGLGGRVEVFDYAFGDYDTVGIVELPDNVTMAALSMAVGAGGAIRDFKTTVLIPMNEAMEAMRRAGTVGYRPPGG